MILKKRKIYYFDEDQIAMNSQSYTIFIITVLLFVMSITMFSIVINYAVKVHEKKQPILIDSRDVIQLTDLIVKHKLQNGSQLMGKPGEWYLVKKCDKIRLK